MYEYAATTIDPIYLVSKYFATKIEVGPSAAPIIDIDAASLNEKRFSGKSETSAKVKRCRIGQPHLKGTFWDESSGPKSIIAPMPIKAEAGKVHYRCRL